MLTVTKIIEGGIDLLTKEELPPSIAISNGVIEITVPVSQKAMRGITQLYIGGLGEEIENQAPHLPLTSKPEIVADQAPPDGIPASVETTISDYDEPPSLKGRDGEEFQPGESYEDSGTGVASL